MTLTLQTIGVGSHPGDGTGDSGQVPFSKTNSNFALIAAAINSILLNFFPVTAAEQTVPGVTINTQIPYGYMSRYGILPGLNDPTDIAAQTALVTALFNPLNAAGPTGNFYFDNPAGNSTYYFGDLCPLRDGCVVDLQWCAVNFSKAEPTGNEVNAGFFMGIRNVRVRNGTINVNFPSSTNGGECLYAGARGNECAFYPGTFDGSLAVPQGNVVYENLYLTTNNPVGYGLVSVGGLVNCEYKNIQFNGQSIALGGFYGEYGWATDASGVLANRQTSHAKNIKFHNWKVSNLAAGVSNVAIEYNGAYSWEVDGLEVIGVGGAVWSSTGESLFYNPQSGVDSGGVTRWTTMIKNVTGYCTGTAFDIEGAVSAAGGYLAATIAALSPPANYIAQTDLVSATIEGFSLVGAFTGNGIHTSAARLTVKDGTMRGFNVGVIATNECTHQDYRDIDILDCGNVAIEIGQATNIWPTSGTYGPRMSIVTMRGLFVAGSGTGTTAGTIPAISLNNVQQARIELCRSGYEDPHDGKIEPTQGAFVVVGANCFDVVLSNNHVGATAGGQYAYSLASNLTSRGCTVVNDTYGATWLATGGPSSSAGLKYLGLFENTLNSISPDNGDANASYSPHAEASTQLFATTLTANRTFTLNTANANEGDEVTTLRTGLGAFTLTVGAVVLPNSTKSYVTHKFHSGAWVEKFSGTLL